MPGSNSDVKIYSGSNDTVTLDTNSTINSLMLGGATNGFTSELMDGGSARTLNITTFLNVGQNGELVLSPRKQGHCGRGFEQRRIDSGEQRIVPIRSTVPSTTPGRCTRTSKPAAAAA